MEDAALVLERLVHHLADRRIEAGSQRRCRSRVLAGGRDREGDLLLGSRQNGGERLALIQHLLNDESSLCACFHSVTLDAQVGARARLCQFNPDQISCVPGSNQSRRELSRSGNGHGLLAGRLQGQQAQHAPTGGNLDPPFVGA